MTCETPNMPPKKKARGPKDRHASGFLVRLPAAYKDKMKALKAKTDRPFTMDVRRAIDAYLKLNGVDPPMVQ